MAVEQCRNSVAYPAWTAKSRDDAEVEEQVSGLAATAARILDLVLGHGDADLGEGLPDHPSKGGEDVALGISHGGSLRGARQEVCSGCEHASAGSARVDR